jgi:hypothetical protein
MMQSSWERNASREINREVGLLAGRLAEFLREKFADHEKGLEGSLRFLEHAFAGVAEGKSLEQWREPLFERIDPTAGHPLHLLLCGFGFSPCEADLLLLAGMAEEHEGFADIFRTLHPRNQPWPTVGLAAHFSAPELGSALPCENCSPLGRRCVPGSSSWMATSLFSCKT